VIKLIDLLEKKMTPSQKKKRGEIYDALIDSGMSPEKAGPIATAKAMSEKLDPVGKEDDDINNDGKVDNKEGDHEVSMAQSSLKSIVKSAVELHKKLGNMERNIPGWIQDHITNAENYIDQAAQGFHELKDDE